MLKVLTELLLHKQVSFEKGKITPFGRPSSLLPTDSFVNIQKELEHLGAENVIYSAAKKSGEYWFEEMNKAYSLKGQDVIDWGSKIVTLAGWGEAVIKKRNDSEKLIICTVADSTLANLYGKSEFAVDHLFRGLLCGAMSAIYKAELDCVETSCVAKGDKICEFVVKPSNQFDMTNPITKKQLAPIKN